jgi:uncharacterized protein (TIGR00645 family)
MESLPFKIENIKTILGKIIFFTRWALIPAYFSLILLIFIFSTRFININSSLILQLSHLDNRHLILESLNLITMILLGGYEISVNKMRINMKDIDRPEWLEDITTSVLKLRIALTIITISSIELLKTFININSLSTEFIKWQIILHITLLASALIFAIIHKLTKSKI